MFVPIALVAAGMALYLLSKQSTSSQIEDGNSSLENIEPDEYGVSMPNDAVELYEAIGWPYNYGMGSPSTPWEDGPKGVDCSGFAQMALVRLGLLSASSIDMSAMSLANACNPVEWGSQRPGDLAIYNGHVMVVYGDPNENGDSRVIGASGGTRDTHGDNPKARVKLFSTAKYRDGFITFGRLKDA